jgi:polygalacturonase
LTYVIFWPSQLLNIGLDNFFDVVKGVVIMHYLAAFCGVLALAATDVSAQSASLSKPVESSCSVDQFGAVANDGQLDTVAFQKAIADCTAKSLTVMVPAGVYDLGQVKLASGLRLHLTAGSVLRASTNLSHFAPHPAIDASGTHRPFIIGAGIKDVEIFGLGVIDGSGPAYWGKEDRDRIRFGLIVQGCSNVKIDDITVRDTPMFLMGVMDCDNVVVDGVTLTAPADSPNTDGLQIIDSHDVRISNCLISVGDDGIVPKMRKRMIERLMVNNCRITSDDGAIKFGTRSSSGMRDSLFSNITITDSRYGIAMFMIHGGVYENIRFSNIRIATAGRHSRHYPIFIDVDDRADSPAAQGTQKRPLGKVHGITFDGLDITTSGNIMIGGHPSSPITDLTMTDIRMRINGAQDLPKLAGKPMGNRTFKPVPGSPDYSGVNAHIVLGSVSGARLSGMDIKHESAQDDRPAIAMPGSTGIKAEGVKE